MTITPVAGRSFITRDGSLANVSGHQPAGSPWPDARFQGFVKAEGKLSIGWTWLENGRSNADEDHPYDIVAAVD